MAYQAKYKKSVNERIVKAITDQLDAGTVPWTKPWVVNSTGIISNASYVAGWRKLISNFKPQDFSECVRQAERACDYIFNTQNKEADNG